MSFPWNMTTKREHLEALEAILNIEIMTNLRSLVKLHSSDYNLYIAIIWTRPVVFVQHTH